MFSKFSSCIVYKSVILLYMNPSRNLVTSVTLLKKKKEETRKEEPKEIEKPPDIRTFKVYRFDGILGSGVPRIQTFELDVSKCGRMLLDAMIKMKDMDPSFTFRRSCREGICGSCAVNAQGSNCLACITTIPPGKVIKLYPIPHMYVIRDLVVDMTHFTNGYDSIKPYLIRQDKKFKVGEQQLAQSQGDNELMVGLYECVLCSCCSTSCPSYWWNGRRFLGPAALLHAYRWVIDSRDEATVQRLTALRDDFKLFRCHTIMNCTVVCPKFLNPAKAIARLKRLVAGLDSKPNAEMNPEKFHGMEPNSPQDEHFHTSLCPRRASSRRPPKRPKKTSPPKPPPRCK